MKVHDLTIVQIKYYPIPTPLASFLGVASDKLQKAGVILILVLMASTLICANANAFSPLFLFTVVSGPVNRSVWENPGFEVALGFRFQMIHS